MRRLLLATLAACAFSAAAAAATVNVTGVAANDTLNLHAAPDAKSARTGTLPPDATELTVVAVDSKGMDWVKVSKGAVSGWVNAKYLAYDVGAPLRLTCQGTEPFWSLSLGYGVASFTMNGERMPKIALDDPDVPGARRSPWLYGVHGHAGSFLLVDRTGKCSDGMSDKVWAYSMLVRLKDGFVEGCCG